MVDFPTITDRNVPNPNRFIMTDVATGEQTTVDLTPNGGVGTEGTTLNKALFDQIKEYINTFAITDGIVISSVSTNRNPNTDWVWEKYSDGRANAWRRATFTVAIATGMLSGFTSNWITLPAIPSGIFAATSAPQIMVTPTINSSNALPGPLAWYKGSGTSAPLATGSIRLENATSMASVTLFANIYAKGMWK